MWASRGAIALALALLAGCDSAPEGPAPGVRTDIATLRRAMIADPARRSIAEAERVEDEQPVLASRLLASGAIPAARRQVDAVRALRMGSDEGRRWAEQLASAYEQRAEGLEQWRAYLADEGQNDEQLLEATTTLRRAEVAIVHVDHEMEEIVPTRRPRSDDGPSDDVPPSDELDE